LQPVSNEFCIRFLLYITRIFAYDSIRTHIISLVQYCNAFISVFPHLKGTWSAP